MEIVVTKGYYSAILVEAPDGRIGVFRAGQQTLTGARDKHGACRCLSASTLLKYLGVRLPPTLRAYMLADDKGIFNPISAVDISQNAHCKGVVGVTLQAMVGAARLAKKG